MSETVANAEHTESDRVTPELATLALLVGPLWIAVGPPGVVLWVSTVLVWYVLDVPSAIAAGVVGLAAAPGYTLEAGPAVIAPLAYVLLAIAAGIRTTRPGQFGVALVGTTGTLVVATGFALAAGAPRWLAGTVLLAVLGSLSYAVSRYERIALETATTNSRDDQPATDTASTATQPATRSDGD